MVGTRHARGPLTCNGSAGLSQRSHIRRAKRARHRWSTTEPYCNLLRQRRNAWSCGDHGVCENRSGCQDRPPHPDTVAYP